MHAGARGLQQYLEELGCSPTPLVISTMQTGEIVTFILGLIALFMVVSILLYYRYCKKKTRREGAL
uniref:Uncharacterized protein n=1 Tax=Parascaris univalens TaxID=6257 RepID=A0A914ZND4_PARUN